jgi:hypothetical protein
MKNIFSGIALPVLLLFSFLAAGQNTKPITNAAISNWVFMHPTLKFNKKISAGAELHWRRDEWVKNPLQILIRPYVNYHRNEFLDLSLGASYYRIYASNPFPIAYDFNEYHIWEQLTLKQNLGKFLKIFHRYRLEQRFIDWMQADSLGLNWERVGHEFKNRFRYRLFIQVPLYQFSESSKLYFNFYNELWMGLNRNLMIGSFLRNRIYTGMGWKFSKESALEIAFLNQFDAVKNNSFLNRNIILLTLNFDFDLSKKKVE